MLRLGDVDLGAVYGKLGRLEEVERSANDQVRCTGFGGDECVDYGIELELVRTRRCARKGGKQCNQQKQYLRHALRHVKTLNENGRERGVPGRDRHASTAV